MNTLTCCLNVLKEPGNQVNQAALGQLQNESSQPLKLFIDSLANVDLNKIQAEYTFLETVSEFQRRLDKINHASSEFIRNFHDVTERMIKKANMATKDGTLSTDELIILNQQLCACSELLVRPEKKESTVIPLATDQEEQVVAL